MCNLKRELILNTSEDIKKYMLEKHGVEVDELDIAELINLSCGFMFDAIKELEGEL